MKPTGRLAPSAVLLLLASVTLSLAQEPPPALTAPVNDFANAIDEQSERELDRRIRALQQATGDVIAVATVPTFQPYSTLEEYALRMFENHGRGIGQKGKDNGALVVVAVNDRKVRIEVGYDLEEFITDGFAGETIRQAIAPEFRRGEYGAGLLAGTTRLINRVASRRGVALDGVPRPAPQVARPAARVPWGLLVPVIWIFIIMALTGRRGQRRRRRWGGPWSGWNSGVGPFGGGPFGGGFGGFGGGGFGRGGFGGGGGFGGFGGGRSGGGGASGGW